MDSYRELVSTTLDVYLSQVNNNLSEIMKRLTGVTVILATIAAIGGIFGMSEAGLAFQFQEGDGFLDRDRDGDRHRPARLPLFPAAQLDLTLRGPPLPLLP